MVKRIAGVVLVLSVLAGIGAGIWYVWFREEPETELKLYGNVDVRESELAFQERQRVEKMIAEEGDAVQAGQLLAKLEERRLTPRLNRARSRLLAEQAVLERLQRGTREENIAKAKEDLKAALAAAENARLRYRRIRDALETGAATQQELDTARTRLEETEARAQSARENLILAEKGPRRENVSAAGARVEALQAEVKLLENRVGDTRLHAPVDGVIRKRVLEPGDMAGPNRPAYTLAITDPVWIRVYIPEDRLGLIAPGMKVQVKTDSFPDKKYTGTIGYISPTAEFTPKIVQTEKLRTKLVYQVRVNVDNAQNELRLGMPATVIIPLKQQPATKPATAPSTTRQSHGSTKAAG
ncbi:MAG: efflux RND transporter periplasmic adaptor subunit [Phycisphaerae bacterium]